jgi:hypothetical protein
MLQIMRPYQFLLILIHGKNNKIICYIKDNTNNHHNKDLFDRINNYFDEKNKTYKNSSNSYNLSCK